MKELFVGSQSMKLDNLPMAAGDYHILDYMIHGNGIIYGTFTYTPEFQITQLSTRSELMNEM